MQLAYQPIDHIDAGEVTVVLPRRPWYSYNSTLKRALDIPGGVELEPGDADEALRAAASIGDDRLQKMSTGRVVPESFTHGSSAQRVAWFKRGMERGDPRACDTFANPQ